uniref:Uncharacterized protein n=1 Tax=Anopheles culicifacies TaxID=139723 RepID=A0A182MPU7_9DIPT
MAFSNTSLMQPSNCCVVVMDSFFTCSTSLVKFSGVNLFKMLRIVRISLSVSSCSEFSESRSRLSLMSFVPPLFMPCCDCLFGAGPPPDWLPPPPPKLPCCDERFVTYGSLTGLWCIMPPSFLVAKDGGGGGMLLAYGPAGCAFDCPPAAGAVTVVVVAVVAALELLMRRVSLQHQMQPKDSLSSCSHRFRTHYGGSSSRIGHNHSYPIRFVRGHLSVSTNVDMFCLIHNLHQLLFRFIFLLPRQRFIFDNVQIRYAVYELISGIFGVLVGNDFDGFAFTRPLLRHVRILRVFMFRRHVFPVPTVLPMLSVLLFTTVATTTEAEGTAGGGACSKLLVVVLLLLPV